MSQIDGKSENSEPTAMVTDTLRDDLVSAAIKFLQNPRVIPRPKSEKEIFLTKKGLTAAEIKAAFKAAGVPETPESTLEHYSAMKTVARIQEYSSAVAPVHTSRWTLIRDILNTIVLLSGAVYGLHYIYKKFIGPWLFGTRSRKKTLEEQMTEMNANLTRLLGDLTVTVQNLSDTVAILRQNQESKSDFKELKSEFSSIKSLLLGRRQFPAPPAVTAPSIPAWQLASTSSKRPHVEITDSTSNQEGIADPQQEGNSLSSSPEIISVEEPNSTNALTPPQSNEGDSNTSVSESSRRDPSESSETGSAEMVDLALGGASGEESGDTD